jgi:DNA-binding IclR family transcriptional regulator
MTDTLTNVNTTERSIEIVELIKRQNGLSLIELTELTGLAKSTVHRHVKTLQAHGFLVERDGQYKIGLRFLDLGIHARNDRQLYEIGSPKIDQIAQDVGEDVWLLTYEGGHSIVLDRADLNNPLQTSERLGQRRILHQSAGGKAILAALPDSTVAEIIETHGLPTLTDKTITEKATLYEELAEIGRRGYACNFGETVEGLNAVSVAITGPDGDVRGAVSVTGPEKRLDEQMIHGEIADSLLAAANEMEISLRYS